MIDKYMTDELNRVYGRIYELHKELEIVDSTLDEMDRDNGDAPHRAVDRCSRIRVLSKQARMDRIHRFADDLSVSIERRIHQKIVDAERKTGRRPTAVYLGKKEMKELGLSMYSTVNEAIRANSIWGVGIHETNDESHIGVSVEVNP